MTNPRANLLISASQHIVDEFANLAVKESIFRSSFPPRDRLAEHRFETHHAAQQQGLPFRPMLLGIGQQGVARD